MLWKRAAFGAVIHNTDDHLRNHGFVRESGRWRLSPVFDVNPNIDRAKEHETSLDGRTDTAGILAALPAAAEAMHVDPGHAAEFLNRIAEATTSSPGLDVQVKATTRRLCADALQTFGRR